MHCSSSFVVRSLSAAFAAALVLIQAGCASAESSSAPSGPSGPTVKVIFDSQPSASIMANNVDLGTTPVTANIEVDESGFLKYPVAIVWNYAMSGGGRSAPRNSTQNWPQGKIPPAKISFVNGILSESREHAPRNPEGTKRTVERYD